MAAKPLGLSTWFCNIHFNYLILGGVAICSEEKNGAIVGHILKTGLEVVGDLYPLQICEGRGRRTRARQCSDPQFVCLRVSCSTRIPRFATRVPGGGLMPLILDRCTPGGTALRSLMVLVHTHASIIRALKRRLPLMASATGYLQARNFAKCRRR